jgi:hypothetical protein
MSITSSGIAGLFLAAALASPPASAQVTPATVTAPVGTARTVTRAATRDSATDSSTITIEAGTRVGAQVLRAISTRSLHAGDTVYLRTMTPAVQNGHIALPAGTYVLGIVETARRDGWLRPRFELRLRGSTLTLANGYVTGGPPLAAAPAVDDNGVRRDDGAIKSVLLASAVAGMVMSMPVVSAVGAGMFVGILLHPTTLAMDVGAPIELVFEHAVVLDARRVADAARGASDVRLAVAHHECFVPGSRSTPDITIPGDPGTPVMGDMPGTPPTPATIIPGTAGTPDSWMRCP